MADYDALTYCKLVGLFNGIVGDTTGLFGDADTRPDLYNTNMNATITIAVGKVESPQLRLVDADPPRTIVLTPIDARVESGVFRLPGQDSAVDGVEVIAKSAAMGLGDTPLLCTVKFAPTTINGARYQLDPIQFVLPTIEPADYAPGRVQIVTLRGTTGAWRVAYDSIAIGSNLTLASTALEFQTALRGLTAIGNNVNVSGDPGGPYTVAFTGPLAAGNPSPLTPTQINLSGGVRPGIDIADQYQPYTVDLTTVERVNTPPSAGNTLVVRQLPDDWLYDNETQELSWYSGGNLIGQPRQVEVTGVPGDFDDLVDATTVGKTLGRASSAAAARRAIGARDEAASGALRPLMMKLERGVENAAIGIPADSLANETTEYAYLFAAELARRYPAYTFNWHLWDAPALANPGLDVGYQANVVIQTGTGTGNAGGPYVVDVWAAAVAGSTTGYFQGSRFSAAFVGKNLDAIIFGYGHNQGGPINTLSTRQFQRNKMMAFLDQVVAANPLAGVVVLLTNPSITNPSAAPGRPFEWVLQRNAQFEIAARMRGWGLLDGCAAFLANPDWATQWISSDGLHPNGAGEQVLANLLINAFDRAKNVSDIAQVGVPPPRRQLFTNPQFSAWGGSLPDGVTVGSGVIITKETTTYRTGKRAMRITADPAVAGQVYAKIAFTADSLGLHGALTGSYKTVRIDSYIPGSNGDVVRYWFQDTPNGSASAMVTDVDSTCRDGWHSDYVTMYFAPNSTGGELRMCPRTGGNSASYMIVDAVEIYDGAVPSAGSAVDTLASLDANDGDYIKRVGGFWVPQTKSQVQTDLALPSPEYMIGAEANMSPEDITGYVGLTTQFATFVDFIAKQNIDINYLAGICGSTVAASLTYAAYAVLSVDPSTGLRTILQETTDDHAIFATAYNRYPKQLGATVSLVGGNYYSYGILLVGTTMPTLYGAAAGPTPQPALGLDTEFFRATNQRKHRSAIRSGQTAWGAVGATYADGTLGAKSGIPYLVGTTA